MSVFIKICGLTTSEAVEAALEAGTNAVGFVFAESPRRVSVEKPSELFRQIPPGIFRVAVMHHPTRNEWLEVQQNFQPDWLQTDVADFSDLDISPKVRRVPVYRDTRDLDLVAAAHEDLVLFEAAVSGRGHQADWNRARMLAETTRLLLAGGLDPENVGAAIEQVQPWGVDVRSGVESSRGHKDPERIGAFINAVREVESGDAG